MAALNRARSPRRARKRNKKINGTQTAPLRICGQSVVPRNPPIEKTRPPKTEAAWLRFQSRQRK